MWHETPIEIRYADTDQMGVVHHSVYPIYCEMGRTDLMAQRGLAYHQLEADGVFLMVVDMHCRYKAPCRYGDRIVVWTKIAELRSKLLVFEYQVRLKDQKKPLFTGSTKHLFSMGTKASISCPDNYWRLLKEMQTV